MATTNTAIATNGLYILPGHEAERQRLIAQHEVLVHGLGGKTVLAPLNLTKSLLILDAGTGPGAWIEDVSKIVPANSILHGIDINKTMFPVTRPLNVSFSVASVVALPDEWANRFDLVHQRLLIWALSTEDWLQSLRNAHRVLRSGGWIQIGEPGHCKGASVSTERLAVLMREVLAFRGLRVDIATAAADYLEQAGFCRVTAERFPVKLGKWGGIMGSQFSQTMKGAFQAMKPIVLRMGGVDMVDPETEFDELLEAAVQEWDAIEGVTWDFWVVCAQKA